MDRSNRTAILTATHLTIKPQKLLIGSSSFLFAMFVSMPSNALADVLEDILVQSTLDINPNTSTPEAYNRTPATSADGGDFLRQINGVSISRFGGRGLEPIIRGQSQTRLNVLLDGAYIHGGCPNRMDPPTSWAALETYEEVTVLKGVQTLLYGGGGSGGTVLFERDTRGLAEDKGIHGRVGLMGSDNGITHDVLADVVAAAEKGYVRGIAQIKSADNYEDGDGVEIRSSFDQKQGGVILGLTPTADRMLEFSYERNDFSDALYPGANMDSPEEKGDIVRFKYEDKPASNRVDSIKSEVYLSDVDHVMNNYELRPAPLYPASLPLAGLEMKRETVTTSRIVGGRLMLESTAGGTKWQYGVDVQNNACDAVLNNMDTGVPVAMSYMWPDVDIDQFGLFAEASTPMAENKKLKYGLRFDRVEFSAGKANLKPPGGPVTANQAYTAYYGETAGDRSETNVGGLLRYEQQLKSGWGFFSGLSRSVRTADATERAINKWGMVGSQRWIGNPGLEPEKHHQFDMGLGYKQSGRELTAVLFYDHVSDYILRDAARGQDGVLLADNADIYRNVSARLYGAELQGGTKLVANLELSGGLAYVNATNTTDDRPIAQTPPLNGKLQLDYILRRWRLGSRLRFASGQDRIDELSKQEVGETGGYGVLDLYGNYRLGKNVSMHFGVDNVLDNTYAEHSSRANLFDDAVKVNEPGRIVWAKFTADF